jgi:broad specificity phosphatase PhoE
MPTRRIYLIRHGEYDIDASRQAPSALTARGIRQARLTARRLRVIPATALYSSDYSRAIQTAEIICKVLGRVPYSVRQAFRECPLAGGHPAALVEAAMRQAETAFLKHFRPARGRDKCDIVVTHGDLIRYLVCRVLQSDAYQSLVVTLNCSVTEIAIAEDGRMRLVKYNDVGHLPPHLVTTGVRRKPPP